MSWHDIALDGAFFVIKSPFRNLWPLVLAPAAAALISDRTAGLLPRTPAGSIPAAALAAVPGLVGLAMILHAINIDPVTTWRGVVAHRLTPLVAAGLLAYAILRAVQRQSQAARLFAVARPASGRLASAAARLGLQVREIPSRCEGLLRGRRAPADSFRIERGARASGRGRVRRGTSSRARPRHGPRYALAGAPGFSARSRTLGARRGVRRFPLGARGGGRSGGGPHRRTAQSGRRTDCPSPARARSHRLGGAAHGLRRQLPLAHAGTSRRQLTAESLQKRVGQAGWRARLLRRAFDVATRAAPTHRIPLRRPLIARSCSVQNIC